MIKITITSIKVDSSFSEVHPTFIKGENAFYIIRESGKRISAYYHNESHALSKAWHLVKDYGLTLVEPW